jgi:hypothetical protein
MRRKTPSRGDCAPLCIQSHSMSVPTFWLGIVTWRGALKRSARLSSSPGQCVWGQYAPATTAQASVSGGCTLQQPQPRPACLGAVRTSNHSSPCLAPLHTDQTGTRGFPSHTCSLRSSSPQAQPSPIPTSSVLSLAPSTRTSSHSPDGHAASNSAAPLSTSSYFPATLIPLNTSLPQHQSSCQRAC